MALQKQHTLQLVPKSADINQTKKFHTFLSSDDNLLPNLILLCAISYNSNVPEKECTDFNEFKDLQRAY